MKPIDLTGQRFGRLVVVERKGKRWLCVCDCETAYLGIGNALRSGRVISCGCAARQRAARIGAARLIDLTGQRFGRLTVVERGPNLYGKRTAWVCRCDCGVEALVAGNCLTSDNTRSCGCYRRNDHSEITYEAAHIRVRQAKGPASAQSCIDCAGPASHWSYDYGDPDALTCMRRGSAYSLSPAHYVPRCPPCHKAHDTTKTPRSA